tara:strand:- start:933 stop:1142 length:210 start_codon:yes stop_codon:yes gene_type:complete
MSKLEEAIDAINLDMLNAFEYGDEIVLNGEYTLYHYCDDDVVVVVQSDEWTEVLQVMWSDKGIEYEALN